jgi:DNA-binding NarL/FixJ family response regulator
VSADRGDQPRVLLGNLEPMVRVGMSGILSSDGVDVVAEDHPASIVAQAERLRPDAVVLDLDDLSAVEVGARVRAAAPQTKVIFWARDEDEMHIFDPGSSEPRLITSAVSDALRSELKSRDARMEGE